MSEQVGNAFAVLNAINVNEHAEKKNGLTYLSWAWAWAEVKKVFPDAQYKIYERPADGCIYWTDGHTCWVKTGVTINGLEHIEYLPVMDYRNNSIPLEKITSTDVNKAIQRSLTKACARHGLGLYIYAGEDLPDDEAKAAKKSSKAAGAKEGGSEAAAERLAARSLCQGAVRLYCQVNSREEKDVWTRVGQIMGKASKDFTVDDWRRAKQIVESGKLDVV